MQKQLTLSAIGALVSAALLATPANAFWDRDGIAADKDAWRAAIESLDTHGLEAVAYLDAFDHIEPFRSEEALPFVYSVVADLRYGITRESLEEAQKEALTQKAKQMLATCETPSACLQEVAARLPSYSALQKARITYLTYEANGLWPSIHGGQTIKPGMHNARVADIRNLLRLTGDLPADVQVTDPLATLYDKPLQEAVKRFQMRHNLDADGVIGPATIEAMQIPPLERAEQISLTMERMRLYEPENAEHHIVVNVPSYHLRAMQGDDVALQMDVIVGKKNRPTALFENSIDRVVINPTWTPTHTILTKDLLPKFRNNPEYVLNGGYKIYDRQGGYQLDAFDMDWENVTAGDVRVVQAAGTRNALGKVKFLLPDNDSIYLHDTAKRHLFSEASRALSSGCVRLSDPKAFMEYVLAAQSEEKLAKGQEAWAGSKRTHMKLEKPIPVQVTYFTASITEEGQVAFHEDVYKKDEALRIAMGKHDVQYAMRDYRIAMFPTGAQGQNQYAQNLN